MDINETRNILEQKIIENFTLRDVALAEMNTLYGKLERPLVNALRDTVYKYYDTSFYQRMLDELRAICEE